MWWDFCVDAEVFYPHVINRFAYPTNDHFDAVIVIIAIISLSYLLPQFKKATWRPELTFQYVRLAISVAGVKETFGSSISPAKHVTPRLQTGQNFLRFEPTAMPDCFYLGLES